MRDRLEDRERSAVGMGKPPSTRFGKDERKAFEFMLEQLETITTAMDREKAAADIDAAQIRALTATVKK